MDFCDYLIYLSYSQECIELIPELSEHLWHKDPFHLHQLRGRTRFVYSFYIQNSVIVYKINGLSFIYSIKYRCIFPQVVIKLWSRVVVSVG